MNSPVFLPHRIATLADAETLEQASARHETACGDGVMVWRRWGSGPPVVMLHGGSGSWNHWVRNIAALVRAGRSVWIPDLPGFGDSARPPGGGDADALPAPLEAALQALLGDTPVDLVGFSFGSMVAAFLAQQWPGRVRRLVISGAPALGINPQWKLVLKPWVHLPPGAERDAALRENLARLMIFKPASNDALALALHAENLPRDRMTLRRLSKTDILARTLPLLDCPVYGIWGEQDALYRGVQPELTPVLARAPQFKSLVLVPDAGHWVQFESAEAFDRALAAALGAA